MAGTEKLTVYASVGSQWANVPLLGLAEKKIPKENVEVLEIDISKFDLHFAWFGLISHTAIVGRTVYSSNFTNSSSPPL